MGSGVVGDSALRDRGEAAIRTDPHDTLRVGVQGNDVVAGQIVAGRERDEASAFEPGQPVGRSDPDDSPGLHSDVVELIAG